MPSHTTKLVTTNIQLPRKLRNDFRKLAQKRDTNVSRLVRAYMRKELQKAK